jgi:MFS family permease
MYEGAMGPRVTRGAVVATLVGNTLEFYDFIAYTFLAVHIGHAFFPTDSAFASLLLSVATFGIGFLTRPLGGVWIGAYADRAGRKPALLLTIALMSVGTLGLVATPSYASIGLAAPIILVISRLAQGFALGGEVGPASAVLLECAPPQQRALYMSLQSASQGVAIMTSGIVGLVIATALTEDQLASWGWRIPFAAGLVLIPVGLYMRRALPETLPEPKHASAGAALRAVWADHRHEVLLLVLVTASSTITTYIGTYMTTFATKTLGMSSTAGMVAPVAMGLMSVIMAPISGVLCERFGRRATLNVSRLLTIALLVPAFLYLIHERSVVSLVVSVVALTIVSIPGAVANLTVMAEVFPTESRGAGIALTYAFAVTIFGATTQFVITWLLDATGSALAPAYYGMAAAAMSVVAARSLFAGPARL